MTLEQFLSTPIKKQEDTPISNLQNKLESANLELADSKSIINSLKQTIERLIIDNNNIKFKSECTESFKNSLENQLKELQPLINEKEYLSKQLDLTKSLLDNSTQNFKLVDIRANQLSDINAELKEKISALDSVVSNLKENISQLNQESNRLNQESNSHKSSSEHLATKTIQLNSTIELLRTKIIDLTHSNNQLQENNNSLFKKYKDLNCCSDPEQFTSSCGTCLSCLHQNLIKESNDYKKQNQELLIKTANQNDELDAAHFNAQDAKEQANIDSTQSNKKIASLSTELEHKNKEIIKLSINNNSLSTTIVYYNNLVHTLVENLICIVNSPFFNRKSIAKKSIQSTTAYMCHNLPNEPYFLKIPSLK